MAATEDTPICHKMVTNKPNGRCCQVSHRHCVLILILGVVLFLQYSSIKEKAPAWNPKQWMQNHSTKLFILFRKHLTGSGNTNGSQAEPAAAGFAATPISMALPQAERILPTQKPQTARLTPGNPGPYLVEYPHEYHFTMNEPKKCEQEKPFVVLMVPVAPRNRAHRDVIRSTWGNESLVLDKMVKLFFLLGMQTGDDAKQVHEQLLQESKEHQDLIQSDFVDCYKNLTIKTMVMLEWLNLYCSKASYAMKIDSDMFLHVPNLVRMLLKAPKTNYMTGLVAHTGKVLRKPSSKWFVPHELFSPSIYPPYALGLGYILSLDLTKKLIEASRHVKAIYIEDVYLGLCMNHLGLVPTDPPGGSLFHVLPLKYSRCAFSKIIATTVKPLDDRVRMWKHFKAEGPYCRHGHLLASFFLSFNLDASVDSYKSLSMV